MYWDDQPQAVSEPQLEDIVDLVFGLSCRCLPVDHAYELAQSIQQVLPWFATEPGAGLHTIHVAGSANGWKRPEQPTDLLYPSRRTKLSLRVPKCRIDDAKLLQGVNLHVGAGHVAEVKQASPRPLSTLPTLFSRYLVTDGFQQEVDVLNAMAKQLKVMGIKPKKMLCGIETYIATPEGAVKTSSLMLAGLSPEEAVILQQKGLGPNRWLGCGIFIPHKDINEIGED